MVRWWRRFADITTLIARYGAATIHLVENKTHATASLHHHWSSRRITVYHPHPRPPLHPVRLHPRYPWSKSHLVLIVTDPEAREWSLAREEPEHAQ
jgi:hypothetical protein